MSLILFYLLKQKILISRYFANQSWTKFKKSSLSFNLIKREFFAYLVLVALLDILQSKT